MDWQNLGVGGLVVVFVMRELFAYLKLRDSKPDEEEPRAEALEDEKRRKAQVQTAQLWAAHLGAEARDADGALRWYMKASTLEAIETTAREAKEHTRLLKKLAGEE